MALALAPEEQMLVLLLLLADGAASQPVDFDTVVTATRAPRPVRDAPADTYVIPAEEIAHSATLTTDELLRSDPDLQTFRRSSSMVADPTSQGLSLRGVGPSGVSRALALLDGVPLNDGYGGWIYWRALPRLAIDHVEVVPGGGSAQYGSAALGGVVQLFSRAIAHASLDADALAGSQGTLFADARAAGRYRWLAGAVEVEGLHSDGFIVTSPTSRGPLDAPAPSTHGTANARLEARVSEALSLQLSGGYFAESQNSGTPLSGNDVRLAHGVLGADLQALGAWQLRLFARDESFVQTRTRVSADRASEALSATQRVPSDDVGASLVWTSPEVHALGLHVLSAGVDVRDVTAHSREALASGLVRRTDGTAQQMGGVYAQESWRPGHALEILGALRFDLWHNVGGVRTLSQASGDTVQALSSAQAAHFSPKLAVRWNALSWLTLRAGVYDSFRAPTLNELYRPFQVGTIVTAANDKLAPETLLGGELGLLAQLPRHLSLRATGFANQLSHPILNVTLASALPDGSARQRENIGGARILGLDAGADWRFARHWLLSLAYTFVDSRVTSAPLLNKRLAQDPAHRFTATLTFADPEIVEAMVQVRVLSGQYEDDLNTLPMAPYAVVDLSLARTLVGPLAVFVAIENLFDTVYVVGRAGIDTVGAPLTMRAGLRLRD